MAMPSLLRIALGIWILGVSFGECADVGIRAPIAISKDGHHFVFLGTTNQFTPWGFNYDHDRDNRLAGDQAGAQ